MSGVFAGIQHFHVLTVALCGTAIGYGRGHRKRAENGDAQHNDREQHRDAADAESISAHGVPSFGW